MADRKRDVVWDTLMEVCGVDVSDIPQSKRGAYNKAVQELKALEATDQEIRAKARAYADRWGRDKLTPNALVAHWAELGAAFKSVGSGSARERVQTTEYLVEYFYWDENGVEFVRQEKFDELSRARAYLQSQQRQCDERGVSTEAWDLREYRLLDTGWSGRSLILEEPAGPSSAKETIQALAKKLAASQNDSHDRRTVGAEVEATDRQAEATPQPPDQPEPDQKQVRASPDPF